MAGERLPARIWLHSQLCFRWTGKCFETATSHMQSVGSHFWGTATQKEKSKNKKRNMKKLSTAIFVSILSLTVCGQNVHTITSEMWTSGSWQNSGKQTNTYDGNGYLTNNLTQLWDSPTSSYKNNSQVNYTNNGNGTIQQYILQTWDNATSSWNNSQRAIYTYFNTTGIGDEKLLSFLLFPNPSIERLNIEMAENNETTYSISDLQGKIIQKNKFLGQKTSIDISTLSPNIYLLILEQSGKKSTAKFVKK